MWQKYYSDNSENFFPNTKKLHKIVTKKFKLYKENCLIYYRFKRYNSYTECLAEQMFSRLGVTNGCNSENENIWQFRGTSQKPFTNRITVETIP